ncbi:hypothetical protein EMCRGX_G009591 [Ephydatia muelleri]
MTTCWNSSANFSCAINESLTINWLINGQDTLKYNLTNPQTNTSGPGGWTTLTIPGSYEFDGANVTCYYTQPSTSLKLYSSPAFLRVQGPPLNVTATLMGNGLIKLCWIPSNGGWIGSFLDYIVLVKDGNGVVVHNERVRNSQLMISTSDPCSQYYATVAPVCQGTVSVASIGGSQIPGVSPSVLSRGNITTKLTYPDGPADNVTVTISIVSSSITSNGGASGPIKLSQTDFEHYRVVFMDILINSQQLRLEPRPIGEGLLGSVYGATVQKGWDCEIVAAHTVKELYSQSNIKQFFEECCRMKTFKHPNVVELIGMCLDSPDGFPLMISPFYPNGNLKTYLQKSRGCSLMVTTLPEWAYGVTCWEIFSLGTTPYPGVANDEMLDRLCEGVRMKKPALCPAEMFKVIECCWNSVSERRPSFLELVAALQQVIRQYM